MLAQRIWPTAAQSLGIALERDSIAAVLIARTVEGPTLRWAKYHTLRVAPAGVALKGPAQAELVEVLRQMLGGLTKQFIPLHVALPDSEVAAQVYELEEYPKTPRDQGALVLHRIAKEFGVPLEGTHGAWQHLGAMNGKQLLLCLGIAQATLDAVGTVFRELGLPPASVQFAGAYQFNRFHDRLETGGGHGAMVIVYHHEWSLMIFDEERRLRFLRTRQRGRDNDDSEFNSIAGETERTIRAYISAQKGQRVARVFAIAVDGALERIKKALDGRMREGVIVLDVLHGLSVMDKDHDTVSNAMLATSAALAS